MSRLSDDEREVMRRASMAYQEGLAAAEGLVDPGYRPPRIAAPMSFEQQFYEFGYRLKAIEKDMWRELDRIHAIKPLARTSIRERWWVRFRSWAAVQRTRLRNWLNKMVPK